MAKSIPEDLVLEIISYLPLKYAAQCKSLNKNLHSLISDPRFAAQHARNSAREITSLFHCSGFQPELFYSIPLNNPHLRNPTPGPFVILPLIVSVLGSCGGLLLLQFRHSEIYCVSNPITGQYQLIPHPTDSAADDSVQQNILLAQEGRKRKRRPQLAGLAFNIRDTNAFSSIKYKVVSIFEEKIKPSCSVQYAFNVFSPETNEWKETHKSSVFKHSKFESKNHVICLDGRLHWLRQDGDIVAFDTNHDHCIIIERPADIQPGCPRWMGVAQGMIILITISNQEIVIRCLYDYDNQIWKVGARIPNISTQVRDYKTEFPIIFDGQMLLLLERVVGDDGRIYRFDLMTKEWTQVGIVPATSDSYQVFVPFTPTLAKVSTLSSVTTQKIYSPDKIEESIRGLNRLLNDGSNEHVIQIEETDNQYPVWEELQQLELTKVKAV